MTNSDKQDVGLAVDHVRNSMTEEAEKPTVGHAHDNGIPPTIESYIWWAARSREFEKDLPVESLYAQITGIVKRKVKKSQGDGDTVETTTTTTVTTDTTVTSSGTQGQSSANDSATGALPSSSDRHGITEAEWEQAQRAFRTATWGSMFYLITTDILGPWGVPWSLAQMGWGPGMILFTLFGILAYYSGLQLWKMFLGLDSTRYPLRNYGDLAFRVFGNWGRVIVNILQSFQFFLNVILLIIGKGQSLGQLVSRGGSGYICFVVAQLICALSGFAFGQIRTLQRLSILAYVAVFCNIVILIITMTVVHDYPPNYDAVFNTYGIPKGPVKTSVMWPRGDNLDVGINGLMNGLCAFGGATIFNEFMAEMRRPWDFWKALSCAQAFIFTIYILMGVIVYKAQGQFAYNPAYQGIPATAYRFQAAANSLAMVAGMIAAFLFSNIAIKIVYSTIFQDVFKMPPLHSKTGRWLWVVLVPVYWTLAFLVAAAVPQVSYLASFLGAACIVQFSYTFPAILSVAYNCQKDAVLPDEDLDPNTGEVRRVDSGIRRLWRGYLKQLPLNIFNTIYFLGALVTAILGIYSSITAMHESYSKAIVRPFSCRNPAG